jgi:hypothetical protein
VRSDDRLKELAVALPHSEPSELALRRLRARVLHDAAIGTVPRRRSALLGIAVASLLVIAGLATWTVASRRAARMAKSVQPATVVPVVASVGSPGSATRAEDAGGDALLAVRESLAGSVVPWGTARWAQTRANGVERIDLDDGTLRIHVRPQVAGERFLVMLPDGELEVRGTTFDVRVEGGQTVRIQVDEGVVEFRLHGRNVKHLEAPATWMAAAPPLSAAPPPGPRPPPSPRMAPADSAYTAAWALLREGRNAEAASAFDTFVLSYPGASQVEDASFLEALSLARAGRPDAAALAAERHLAIFPRSFHRKEASILVARAASNRGDCSKARAVLAPWARAGAGTDADTQSALRGCEGR